MGAPTSHINPAQYALDPKGLSPSTKSPPRGTSSEPESEEPTNLPPHCGPTRHVEQWNKCGDNYKFRPKCTDRVCKDTCRGPRTDQPFLLDQGNTTRTKHARSVRNASGQSRQPKLKSNDVCREPGESKNSFRIRQSRYFPLNLRLSLLRRKSSCHKPHTGNRESQNFPLMHPKTDKSPTPRLVELQGRDSAKTNPCSQ